jgi:plasmid replication initiation protein
MSTDNLLDENVEIRQDNALTTACHQMTAQETDIIFCLFSRLRKQDSAGTYYRVYLKELERITGREWNYKQLMASAASLRTRELSLKRGKNSLQVGLLASVEYLPRKGCIELELSEKIRPYLIDLQKNFTSFRLHAALRLTSKYAKRIYQLVSQWKDRNQTRLYTIDELKIMLGLKDAQNTTEEQYKKFSMFQKSVLAVAVQQINQHTELTISYTLHKRGRSFDTIRFAIQQKEQQQVLPVAESALTASLQVAREQLVQLKIIDPRLVAQILNDATLRAELFKFSYSLKTDKLKSTRNPGGLFLTIVGLSQAEPKALKRAAKT